MNGIRHEDIEAMSFSDESFDVIVSNDVLEHVNRPRKALSEIWRVLTNNGHLIMTVPFGTDWDKNTTRAQIVDGDVLHYSEPIYHGNPVADEGSLVFTDFGWELMDWIKEAGFSDVAMAVYTNTSLGHLGGVQFFIEAAKEHILM